MLPKKGLKFFFYNGQLEKFQNWTETFSLVLGGKLNYFLINSNAINNISKNYNFLQLPLGDIQGWKRFCYIKSLKNTIFSTKMDLFLVSIYFNWIIFVFWGPRVLVIDPWRELLRILALLGEKGALGGPQNPLNLLFM